MNDPVTRWIESPVGAVASALLQGAPFYSSSGTRHVHLKGVMSKLLQRRHRPGGTWSPRYPDYHLVKDPKDAAELTLADVENVLLSTAMEFAPWNGDDSETNRTACMQTSEERRPLVEAVLDHWLPELQRGISWPQWTYVLEGQTGFERQYFARSDSLRHNCGEGQFPLGGAWSFTPTDASPDLILDKWELDDRTLTVVELTAASQPRVAVVNGVQDWADLIQAYPGEQTRIGLAPDWPAIAENYDAVHLTWWGFVTLFANREATDRHGVIPLVAWNGEQTLWLNADKLVFGRRITLTADD